MPDMITLNPKLLCLRLKKNFLTMLITVGAFDGFHKGHEKLLDVCRQNAVDNDWGVVTFYPHPSEFMGVIAHSLFTFKEKIFISRKLGIPNIFFLKFDEALKNLSPFEFIDLLIKKFNVTGIVAGSDFHFGHDRAGGIKYLNALAAKDKIKFFPVDLFNKGVYSSSLVRKKILEGDVEGAEKILGYHWFIISDVIHGQARGRKINFPTANINLTGRLVPSYGVYSTAVLINNKWYCGACSIGNNPTFGDVKETRAEIFITDFEGNLYGSELLVKFLGRVRGIKTFENPNALKAQISLDIQTCKEIFNRSKI